MPNVSLPYVHRCVGFELTVCHWNKKDYYNYIFNYQYCFRRSLCPCVIPWTSSTVWTTWAVCIIFLIKWTAGDDADCAAQTRYGLSANGKLVYSDKRGPENGFVNGCRTGIAQPEEEWKMMNDPVVPSFDKRTGSAGQTLMHLPVYVVIVV